MAKYEKLYPDTEEMIKQLLDVLDLSVKIDVKMRADNNQQKDVIKLTKSNDLNKELGKYDIAITVNQRVFEMLDEPMKVLVLQEKLSSLSYNYDKDKIEIKPYDVQTNSGFLNKYGYENYTRMETSVKTVYSQIKEQDEEMKAAAKMGKR